MASSRLSLVWAIEPGDGDGQRGHSERPDRERLPVHVDSRNKEEGQMPAGPDQPEQYARPRESEAGRQTGKGIAAPSVLFTSLYWCVDDS